MWLLTHDGDLTQKKRYWLRPGTSHLLGRTRSENADFHFHIDAKSVSRKHLVITVREAAASTATSSALARSEIVLEDSSKFGTWLDGEKFTGCERVIGGGGKGYKGKHESHEIRLGNWNVAWRLEWQPVVLTASFGGGGGASSGKKKKKGNKSEVSSEELRERLAPFDIAVVPEYVAGVTTHVVAPKRNTPRVLQALVQGKYVVSEGFVDALEKVARKEEAVMDADGNEEVPRAPLEEDFDGNWPREADFVPPTAKEPVPRPAEMVLPDPERETVFEGYTFIFSDQNQFDQLGPVVEQGTGKALLRKVETGSDETDGFIRFVKNAAGEKEMDEFVDGSRGKGVVVVRLAELRGNDDEWWMRFYNSVDLGLNQRSINQNDFLDAILTNDASPLRQPLEPESDDEAIPSSIPGPPPSTSVGPSQMSVVPSREAQTQAADESPTSAESPVPKTTRKGFRRALTVSRFKGIDDFDPDIVPKRQHVSDDDDEMASAGASHFDASQSSVAQSQQPGASQARTRATRGKKRQLEPAEVLEISDDDYGNATDKLFPAASAMKRRKLEQQLHDAAMEDIPEASEDSPRKSAKRSSLIVPSELRKSRPEKDIDAKQIKQMARERREREDEQQRQAEEDALREVLEGMDIDEMKKLAKVEIMEIRPRKKPVQAEADNDDEDRWKPEWNGRKNFKKFRKRRPGDNDGNAQAPLRSRRVIVTLEEVRPQDMGFNAQDEFMLDNTSTFDSIRTRPRAGRSAGQSSRSIGGASSHPADTDDDDDDDESSFRRRTARHRRPGSQQQRSGPASAIVIGSEDEAEMQDLDPEEIAGRPRNESIASALSSASNTRPGSSHEDNRSRRAATTTSNLPPTYATAVASDKPRGPPPPLYSQRAPSPALSSQTLADDGAGGTYSTQRRGSRASAASGVSASTAATATTRGAASSKRGAMGPPGPSAEQPAAKKQKKGTAAGKGKGKGKKGGGGQQVVVPKAELGKGLGKPEDEDENEEGSDDSGDDLKFRRRRG
ncbi:hypothetical protein BFW01_g3911 [Lasiodiplodia theobromae]|nr:hypothetical protein BFW01_g3911 [Lasiodiplodia theobromae]